MKTQELKSGDIEFSDAQGCKVIFRCGRCFCGTFGWWVQTPCRNQYGAYLDPKVAEESTIDLASTCDQTARDHQFPLRNEESKVVGFLIISKDCRHEVEIECN